MFATLLAIFVISIAAIISFYKRRYSYWASLGIPGPEPIPFLGNLATIASNKTPRPLELRKWTRQFGKVYGYYEGVRKVLVISDPSMAYELFVKKFDCFHGRKLSVMAGNVDTEPRVHVFDARGLRWKRLRTLTAPAFSTMNLKKIRPTVEDSVFEMVKLLEKSAGPEEPVNILEFYQEYTMDVICRVAMGQKESKQFNNEYTKSVLGVFSRNLFNPWYLTANAIPRLAVLLRKGLFLSGKITGNVAFVTLIDRITKAVEERANERDAGIQSDSKSIDFIDLFLDAKVEETFDGEGTFTKGNAQISRVLTKDEITAQCLVFLLAGFDTTANSLSYVSYLIAKHPHVLKKLQEEVDEFCVDEEIPYDVLTQMKYMDNVVREGLRMYPLAAFANSRECMVPTTIGDIPIEKGTLVAADAWTMHYDKQLWGENADEFVPERWDSEERRGQLSWLPFGAGPRQCIGMRLAYLEEKLALAHILRKFDIVQGEKTEKSLKLVGSLTTSPEAVHVYLKKRDN